MNDSYPAKSELSKGSKVSIVEKQNQSSGEETVGTIKEIFTKSDNHPHGIKVKLTNGKVGRVKHIL